MTKYDLSLKISSFLDRHMTLPLWEFSLANKLYKSEQLLEYILETVDKTNMIDYMMDIRKRAGMGEEMPEELVQRKAELLANLRQLKNDVAPIMQAAETLKSSENMKESKCFMATLQKDHNFKPHHLESAYKLAKYLYECGNYADSTSYLYFCLIVMSPSDKNYLSVLWGKLAAEILQQNWITALDDLNTLREYIDGAGLSPVQALQQRTWLIHWAVIIFFNHPNGSEPLVEWFLHKPFYLNAIQTTCSHILRYVTVAVVINPTRRNTLKDLIKVIQQESYTYRDPITEFLECLYVNFDFESARKKLHECQTVIQNDFFIQNCLDEFVQSARLMIFEVYCRLHQCIKIDMIAQKLNMQPNEAECWIVNLIRNARLDAKIDSKLGLVVMGSEPACPYTKLAAKLNGLEVRADNLKHLIEHRKTQKNPGNNEPWKYTKAS